MDIHFWEAFKIPWQIVFGFVLLVVLLIILTFVTSLFEKPIGKYQYLRKDSIMTQFEREFYKILLVAIENQYHVFPQVHLDAILNYKVKGQKNWFGAFRHINEKSVDFVICDKEDHIKTLLAIELDDSTHERYTRKERDGEVERILSEAGMPLLRVKHSEHYEIEDIKRLIFEKLNSPEHPVS